MNVTRKDSSVPRWTLEKVVDVFGADLRSLATFRVVLALLVLSDLANRATDLSAHYADEGVLARAVLLQEGLLESWSFSLNLMNGEPFFQALLFGAGALAALGLLVGYRTRPMTVIAWVVLLSIQHRNPMVLTSGDILLRLLLFWGMFLPLGAVWSVDRALKAALPRLSMRFLSLATVGLFMQIAFMYWFTAILKSGKEWRVDGTALYYALSFDQITTRVGSFLHSFPSLLEALTFATLFLEAFGPLLLFCPLFTGPVRTLGVAAFMSLHFGIWLTMDIGLFPWISAFCMVCFLPSWFWDKPVAILRGAIPRRFDIARDLQRAVGAARAYLSPLRTRLSAITHPNQLSFAGPTVGAADRTENGTAHGIAPLASAKARRRKPYAGAGNEPGAGSGGAATGPGPTLLKSSLATNLLAAFFLAYVFSWNLTTVSSFTMPERMAPVGPLLGLDQYWGMFAPYPSKEDGWYVIPGNLRDGQQVDLSSITRDDFGLHPVSWEKPRYVADTYKNEHWRKYLERIWQSDYADQRLYFGQYICREWNARHTGPEELTTFEITYMLEETLPDYRSSEPQKVSLWKHSCF